MNEILKAVQNGFVWNEEKREKVLAEHGIDLLDAALIFEKPEEVEWFEDTRKESTERRWNAIGPVEEIYYELVFTIRDDKIRLITCWKLNEKSRRKAIERHARRLARVEESR